MDTLASASSRIALLGLLLAGYGCGARPGTSDAVTVTNRPAASTRVREPAVAGLFYPGDAATLSQTVDRLLKAAPEHQVPRLKALVCPHAGYEFSGQTAAIAYKTLIGRDVQTVIVMGPSHYAWFHAACIPNADEYRTPLGSVAISPKAKELASVTPFALEAPCLVERPAFASRSPKAAPPPGEDTPETWEHSVEVQVPFLQKTLKDFKLVPVVVGNADPEEIAKALADRLDDKTIIVASSDLSHYHPYSAAKELDSRCVKAICDVAVDQMKTQEACGRAPVMALLYLAHQKGWKAQLLDYRNSGDVTGEKDRVVGYAAVAFYSPAPDGLAAADKQLLLELARRSLKNAAANHSAPEVSPTGLQPKLKEKKACFVTLTKAGTLRGCIGHLTAMEALYQAVIDNARNAAVRDPRFLPVQPDEVDQLKIEISVLTEPQPLSFSSPEDLLSKLHPNDDGVILHIGPRTATFLPQVWAQLPDKEQFLNHLAQKAGCEASDWRGKDTQVSIYHVECFQEGEGPGPHN